MPSNEQDHKKVSPENVPRSLMESVTNDYVKNSLVSAAEEVTGSLLSEVVQNEAALKIPVVGTILGAAKGAMTFRDRRYVSKILDFLIETSKASEDDREAYQRKIDNNPDEANRAGAVILDIIDKITDQEKARMLGKIFRAFMREEGISFDQLLYLCEIVQRAYIKDLEDLARDRPVNEVNLENIGVKKPIRAEEVNKVIEEVANQAVEVATSRAGAIKEAFTTDPNATSKELAPQVEQSGLTDEGSLLVRILREY